MMELNITGLTEFYGQTATFILTTLKFEYMMLNLDSLHYEIISLLLQSFKAGVNMNLSEILLSLKRD